MLASYQVWITSYHLVSIAQTWYYALEQDKSMQSWERFKDLCQPCFGPAIRSNRLAELAQLPVYSMV